MPRNPGLNDCQPCRLAGNNDGDVYPAQPLRVNAGLENCQQSRLAEIKGTTRSENVRVSGGWGGRDGLAQGLNHGLLKPGDVEGLAEQCIHQPDIPVVG